jgi:hypothetical protein
MALARERYEPSRFRGVHSFLEMTRPV